MKVTQKEKLDREPIFINFADAAPDKKKFSLFARIDKEIVGSVRFVEYLTDAEGELVPVETQNARLRSSGYIKVFSLKEIVGDGIKIEPTKEPIEVSLLFKFS